MILDMMTPLFYLLLIILTRFYDGINFWSQPQKSTAITNKPFLNSSLTEKHMTMS